MAGHERVVADVADLIHGRPERRLRRIAREPESAIVRALDQERIVAVLVAADQLVVFRLAEVNQRLEACTVVRRAVPRVCRVVRHHPALWRRSIVRIVLAQEDLRAVALDRAPNPVVVAVNVLIVNRNVRLAQGGRKRLGVSQVFYGALGIVSSLSRFGS